MAQILARGAFIAPSYLLGRAALARQGDALVLVDRGGEVRAPLTFSRAQAAGVEATGFDGVAWRRYGADVPRWVGAEARLLIEGQRTNAFTHPRLPWDGLTTRVAVTRGTGATAPIGGVTTDRIVETTATSDHYVEGLVTIPANQTNTTSILLRPAGRTRVFFIVYDSANYANFVFSDATLVGAGSVTAGNGGTGSGATASIADVGNGWYRLSLTGIASSAANDVRIRLQLINASTIYAGDGTSGVDVWGLQAEAGSFASTPILPPIGTPGASTRGADRVSAPLSSLGIGGNGACTALWRGALSATNVGDNQTIVGIDDGTDANRCDIRITSAGDPQIIRVTAGIPVFSLPAGGPFAANTTFRAGIAIDGAGRVASSFNGNAVSAVTGAPTSGLTTFNHGISRAAVRLLWGETYTLTVLPRVLSDAELQAAVAAL